MTEDPTIEEIRKNRQQLAKRFNYDLRAIVADARKRQGSHGKMVVSFARIRKRRMG